MKNGVRFWVFFGVIIVFVFVLIFIIKILFMVGYFNIGDVVIMFFFILFGKSIGFMGGSFGFVFVDIVFGYIIYVFFIFVIKGFEGFICGLIFEKLEGKKKWVFFIILIMVSGIFMVVGYFLLEVFVLKYFLLVLNINRDL